MGTIRFPDLEAFITVVKLKSFSQAARTLHTAQSALSRRVLRLERDLGITLLERRARGVEPTAAGLYLAERGERLGAELAAIEHETRALGNAVTPELRVAMPQGAARLFVTATIARYRRQCPSVRLVISERESALNREGVLKGEADLGLAYDPLPSDDLIVVPLLHERVLVIGPPNMSSALPERYDIEALSHLPLILPGAPHGYRRIVEQSMALHGLRPHVTLEVNGFATSLTLVQQGLGYGISTFAPVQAAIEAGALVGVPIMSPGCEVALSLMHRRNKTITPALAALMEAIQEVSSAIEPSPFCRPA